LTRFGVASPKAKIKIIIPSRTDLDEEPIIIFNNLSSSSGDIGYPTLSNGRDILVQLDRDGFRKLYYSLNTPSIASSAVQQASSYVNFGHIGPESASSIAMNIIASDNFSGDAGNKLIFSIVENSELHSSYATCEVKNNSHVILTVAETPYIVYELIDALTGNSKVSDFVDFDLSLLYNARDASTASSEWRSSVIGDFILQGGSGSMYTIKDKEYEIQLLNIYNNEAQKLSVIPTVYSIAK
jgi:hypothetical protein